jgi:hypothetical protein
LNVSAFFTAAELQAVVVVEFLLIQLDRTGPGAAGGCENDENK